MAKRLRFVVSLMTKDNDYQLEQAASAQQAAHKLGIDVQILYADNDPITQSTQLLKAIQASPETRPNGIVFEPAGGTAFPQAGQAGVQAKLAWGRDSGRGVILAQFAQGSSQPVLLFSPRANYNR